MQCTRHFLNHSTCCSITHVMSLSKRSFVAQTEELLQDSSDLKTLLSKCTSDKIFTTVSELRLDCGYRVFKFDRVIDIYGDFLVIILEGLCGDDFYLTVPVLTERRIQKYNMGL